MIESDGVPVVADTDFRLPVLPGWSVFEAVEGALGPSGAESIVLEPSEEGPTVLEVSEVGATLLEMSEEGVAVLEPGEEGVEMVLEPVSKGAEAVLERIPVPAIELVPRPVEAECTPVPPVPPDNCLWKLGSGYGGGWAVPWLMHCSPNSQRSKDDEEIEYWEYMIANKMEKRNE